jgi:hypothetical protein
MPNEKTSEALKNQDIPGYEGVCGMNIQIFGKTECLRVKMLLNQCFEIVSIETYDQFTTVFSCEKRAR